MRSLDRLGYAVDTALTVALIANVFVWARADAIGHGSAHAIIVNTLVAGMISWRIFKGRAQ